MLGHFLAHTRGFTLYGVLFDFACNIRFDLFKHPSVLIARLFIGALSILFLSGQYRCIGCKIRKNTATLKNQSRTKREYQKSLNKGITTIQTSFKQNSPRLLLTSVNLFYGLILCVGFILTFARRLCSLFVIQRYFDAALDSILV